jgi:hypothetical protein
MTTAVATDITLNNKANGAVVRAGHDDNGDVAGMLGGVGVLFMQACALMPGLLPCLLLAAVFTLPLVLPLVVLGVVGGLLAALVIGLWRLAALVASLSSKLRGRLPTSREPVARAPLSTLRR